MWKWRSRKRWRKRFLTFWTSNSNITHALNCPYTLQQEKPIALHAKNGKSVSKLSNYTLIINTDLHDSFFSLRNYVCAITIDVDTPRLVILQVISFSHLRSRYIKCMRWVCRQGRREPGRAPGQLVDAGPLPDTGTKSAQLEKFREFQNVKMVDLFVAFWD